MMVPRLSAVTAQATHLMPGLSLEPAELSAIRAARGEQQLQVGRGQALAAVAEELRPW